MRGSRSLGRPSPAMIVAIVALIVALGGTSYAAVQLSANSVGTKQIRKNAVTAPKVKGNAITTAKIRNSAVTRPKIANGAINPAKLAAIPAALARASSIQSVADFTATTINLDVVSFDSGGIFDPAQKAMIVPRNGVYQLSGTVGWLGNPAGTRQLRIVVDGQVLISALDISGGTGTRQNASGTVRLSAGQKVTLAVFQNSGVALNTQISEPQQAAWLSMAWLGN